MPSQEDYLDQLLKGIESGAKEEETAIEETAIEEPVIEEIAIEEDAAEGLLADDVAVETDLSNLVSEDDILKQMVLENITVEDVLGDEVAEVLENEIPDVEIPDIEVSDAEIPDIETSDEEAFGMDALDVNMEDLLASLEEEPEESDTMSVEEIEQLLAANNLENAEDEEEVATSDEDLMSMLNESDENDLQDIYDMLNKSDNNEAVDEEMLALLQEDAGIDEAARLQAELDGTEEDAEAEGEVSSERQQKAMDKKRLKEEKAAAKRAAKEAKKAEKEAKRAAKKASKKQASENVESEAVSENAVLADAGNAELFGADMMDMDDLLAAADAPAVQDEVTSTSVDEPQASTDEDMMEIDELLNLAGISGMVEADSASAIDAGSDVQIVDEAEIQDLLPEKEKKGLFARILDFLTEADEDDEEEKGIEDIPLSDENKNILEEMDKEEKSGKKGKKPKKDKKAKKGKKGQTNAEDLGEEDEEDAPKEKKGKKAKKPKKEKPVKEKPVETQPKGKLPVKAMISVAAVCASIMAVILLLVNLGGDFAAKREAKKAYYQEDYETCYKTLYGRELNESEQVMFAKSESILRINLRMRQYEIFAEEQADVEALDVLIQTAHDYAKLYEYASKWNAGEDVAVVYNQMLGIMQDKYHLTESEALEIAAEPDDVVYTRIVTAVAAGEKYKTPKTEEVKPVQTDKLPDMLPEETKFPENNGGR